MDTAAAHAGSISISSDQLCEQIHWLPCNIAYEGPVPVDQYFCVEQGEGGAQHRCRACLACMAPKLSVLLRRNTLEVPCVRAYALSVAHFAQTARPAMGM